MSTYSLRGACRSVARDGIGYDPRTGEWSATLIAEAAAAELGRWDWLDDPDHEIWDAALAVAEARTRASARDSGEL